MSKQPVVDIAVLGAGAWGTTLALLLARNGHAVRLWDPHRGHITALLKDHRNERHIPGVDFPENISVFKSLRDVLKEISNVLIAFPSHTFHALLAQIQPYLSDNPVRLVWGTKGLSQSGQLFSADVKSTFGTVPMAVISGPSFAKEVAAGLPTAVVAASREIRFAQEVAQWLHNETLRVYTSTDMAGVQICGAVKNVLAIAVGVADGLGLGANARCALITRGLAELARLGEDMGGQLETFMGLAGMGDLVLTCTDDQSRNRRFGLYLGRGLSIEEAAKKIDQVIEGRSVTREVYHLAKERHIEMPICEQVYRVIEEGISPQESVRALMSRPPQF